MRVQVPQELSAEDQVQELSPLAWALRVRGARWTARPRVVSSPIPGPWVPQQGELVRVPELVLMLRERRGAWGTSMSAALERKARCQQGYPPQPQEQEPCSYP